MAKSDPDADNRLRLVRFQSAPLHRLNIKLQGYAYPEGGSIVQTPVLWKAKDLSKFNAPGFDNGPRKRRSNAKLPVKANGELEDAFLPSLSVYLVLSKINATTMKNVETLESEARIFDAIYIVLQAQPAPQIFYLVFQFIDYSHKTLSFFGTNPPREYKELHTYIS